jgi:outer membrane lipoprotein-sorting protein
MKKTLILLVAAVLAFGAQAQKAEEIVSTYLENIGGKENLAKLETMVLTGKSQAQGMEIPVTMYQTADGKQRMDLVFQGQQVTQMAFDGEEGWGFNFQAGKAEKMDSKQSKMMKTQTQDFPDPFLNYQEKGYTIEYMGEEEVDGTPTYKIKLTKDPLTIDGEEVENFSYYYFDQDAYVPIMQEDFAKMGPAKGQSTKTYTSDYKEVAGVYMPHSMSQKMNGQEMFSMAIEEIKINEEIEEGFFDFPEQEETSESDK